MKKPSTDAELIWAFAQGIEEKHYTTVALFSPSFVVFRIAGHTAWASVGERAYVRTQHVLIRKGDWWMSDKPQRRWEGRVKPATLKEALRRSEMTKQVYTGDFTAPMCEECDEEMNYGEGQEGGKLIRLYSCDECGWSEDILMKNAKVAAPHDWEKRLSAVAKAEVLAGTFHLLSDHMPKVWKKVPAWLREQIKQAMRDCSVDYKDFTPEQLKLSVDYCQWLNEKYPQPGSPLALVLMKKRKKKKSPTNA